MREPHVNQFIVENLGGMFISSDTVRIDNDLLLKWKEMYDDREIVEVKITTFGENRSGARSSRSRMQSSRAKVPFRYMRRHSLHCKSRRANSCESRP